MIDAFNPLCLKIEKHIGESPDKLLRLWQDLYMTNYPELFIKLTTDYTDNDMDWQEYGQKEVFPVFKQNFSKMQIAHTNLLNSLSIIHQRAESLFKLSLPLEYVIYSGLLNSAGWADNYNDSPAILFGVDKIAQLNWHSKTDIETLVAHEITHCIHFYLRSSHQLTAGEPKNPYESGLWRLYTEGFAQYGQSMILSEQVETRGTDWLDCCRDNFSQLKQLYRIALADSKFSVQNFYGDWYEVLGISDAGYYLGQRLIEESVKQDSLYNIAIWPPETIRIKIEEFLA